MRKSENLEVLYARLVLKDVNKTKTIEYQQATIRDLSSRLAKFEDGYVFCVNGTKHKVVKL